MWAALAIEAGQCEVALIAYGSNQRTTSGGLVNAMRPTPYEAPYRLARPVAPMHSRLHATCTSMAEARTAGRGALQLVAGLSSIQMRSCAIR